MIRTFITQNLGLFLGAFSAAALIAPQLFSPLEPIGDELLMMTLFLGCLRIRFGELIHLRQNAFKLLAFAALTMVLFPLVIYILLFSAPPEIMIGFVLLAAAPGAVLNSLIAGLHNLKVLWATAFTVLTSLLAPLSIPFLSELLFDVEVAVSATEMGLFLARMIFVPAIAAILVSKFLPKMRERMIGIGGAAGVMIMSLFLAVIIAESRDELLNFGDPLLAAFIVIGLLLLFVSRFIIGFVMPTKTVQERWTNALMLGFMNNGLIILLAGTYFSPTVLLVVLLSEVPWVLLQPVFQDVIRRFGAEKIKNEAVNNK